MDLSDIRKGLKILLDGQPFTVVEHQFVKPGKGQAFTRCKLRNLQTGNVLDRTFRASDKIEPADVEERSLQYIYPDGNDFVFMDEGTGEQIVVPGEVITEEAKWLSDGLKIDVTIFKGAPIGVNLPSHVTLQITESEPGVKGDTASGTTKPATLSTGAVVQVPLFINEGEWIRIDTRTGQYLERVKRD